jgi:hypothetical protein
VYRSDKDVWNLLAELHRVSVLSLNGFSGLVTFPFPPGRAAFEETIKVCNVLNPGIQASLFLSRILACVCVLQLSQYVFMTASILISPRSETLADVTVDRCR